MLTHLLMVKMSVVKMCVSITNNKPIPYTICVCLRQSMSVTDSLFLSQTICVCHRQSVSVANSMCLSQTICVTDSFCLSQTFCVCHRQSVSVTDNLSVSLCLYQTLFLIILGLTFTNLYVVSSRFVRGISVFPRFQSKLCGPLVTGDRWLVKGDMWQIFHFFLFLIFFVWSALLFAKI